MARMKVFKAALVCGSLLAGLLLMASSSRLAGTSEAAAQPSTKEKPQADAARRHTSVPPSAQYVGAETCQVSHDAARELPEDDPLAPRPRAFVEG